MHIEFMVLANYKQTQQIEFISGYVRNKDDRSALRLKNLPGNTTEITQHKIFSFDLERTIVQVVTGHKPIYISDGDCVLVAGRVINGTFYLLAYKNLSNGDIGDISSVAYKFTLGRARILKIFPICLFPFSFYVGYENPWKFDATIFFILFPCIILVLIYLLYLYGCLLEKEGTALNNLKNQVESMETPETKLYKLQQNAFIYLKELLAQGATINYKAVFLLKDELRISQIELEETENYLKSKGFIDWFDDQGSVYLTPAGISYLENILSQNNQPPFPNIVNNIFTAPVGAVQSGSNNTANINQSWGLSLSEVKELIGKLRETFREFPDETRVEALDLVVGLENEVQSTQPSKTRIRTFLNALTSFATDTVQKIIIETLKNQTGV